MSRLRKKGSGVAQQLVSDGGLRLGAKGTTAQEMSAVEVHVARVSSATASLLDQVGFGKEKFLKEVITPKSKQKPPLPVPRKRKHPHDEENKQIKRRQNNTPPHRKSGRLEPAVANEGVHIHVNLDGSAQLQSKSASPKKITVWVSPRKLSRRARRSLEVTTMPQELSAMADCSGAEEEPAQQRSCSDEDLGEHPTAVEDLESHEVPMGDPLSGEVGVGATPNSEVPDASGSGPSILPATKVFDSNCGVSSYMVDLPSGGDDGGLAPTPVSDTLVKAISPKCTPPPQPLPQKLNFPNCTPPSCNSESPEEALDRIITTLPTSARLKWLSTRVQHITVSSTLISCV